MALAEIGARLRLQGADRFRRDADRAADATGRLGSAANRATRGLGSLDRAVSSGLRAGLRGVGGAARLAGAGLGVAAVAAGAAGFKFLQLATDAGETESKFKTVFGSVAADVAQFNTRISNAFGNTTKSLQDATATFGVYGQGAGLAGRELVKFSTGLVQAGLDLGSFYNASSDEVFQAIQSGLSGEAEPLRRFAIFLSDVNLNALAAAEGLGKTTAQMTEQEKVALRGRFIMANLGKAQGDLAKTSGGLANQQRALQGRLEETGTILGKALLPGATKATTILNSRLAPAMTRLRDLAPSMEKKFSGVVDKIFKFGDAMMLAGKLGGTRGMVQMLDQMTGSGGNLTKKFDELVIIIKDVLIPTGDRIISTLGKAMTLVANNTTTAYVALGLYLTRTKLIAAATLAAKAYAGVMWLLVGRHAAQGTAAAAAAATTVAGHNAATASAVKQAVVIGRLRYAYLALGGGPVLAAVAGLAAVFGGLAYQALQAEKSAVSIKNLQAGAPTATTGPTVAPRNNPLQGSKPVNGVNLDLDKPLYDVPTPAVKPRPPASATSKSVGSGAVNITPAPVIINMDGKVVGEGVVRFMQDRQARR